MTTKVRVTVELTPEQHDRMKPVCDRKGVKVGAKMRELMLQWVENNEATA